MPLKPFRRHSEGNDAEGKPVCSHAGTGKDKGRNWERCKCPIWIDGTMDSGRRILESAKTRVWSVALSLCREMENKGRRPEPISLGKPIREAIDMFLASKEADKVSRGTMAGYRYFLLGGTDGISKRKWTIETVTPSLAGFAEKLGIRDIQQFTAEHAEAFRNSWKVNTSLCVTRKLIHLRAFLSYCVQKKWHEENYGAAFKYPKDRGGETLPLSIEEVKTILGACDRYRKPITGARTKALVLLLRYSGLRIGDAVTLHSSRLVGEKLQLRTAKGGVVVNCLLPPIVLEALDAIEPVSPGYWFWNGREDRQSTTQRFRMALADITKDAGIVKLHFHRLRDTYAFALLQARVPIEEVQKLLGHRSIKVTVDSYGAWVRDRQTRLEDNIRDSWKDDGLLSPTEKAKVLTMKKRKAS